MIIILVLLTVVMMEANVISHIILQSILDYHLPPRNTFYMNV